MKQTKKKDAQNEWFINNVVIPVSNAEARLRGRKKRYPEIHKLLSEATLQIIKEYVKG